MKKILMLSFVFASLALFFPKSSQAGMTCSTDAYGNTSCYGTGSDTGYNTTMSTDAYGNTNVYDNQGGSMTCSTDAYGNTSCY